MTHHTWIDGELCDAPLVAAGQAIAMNATANPITNKATTRYAQPDGHGRAAGLLIRDCQEPFAILTDESLDVCGRFTKLRVCAKQQIVLAFRPRVRVAAITHDGDHTPIVARARTCNLSRPSGSRCSQVVRTARRTRLRGSRRAARHVSPDTCKSPTLAP